MRPRAGRVQNRHDTEQHRLGGDTLAAIAKYGIEKQVDYISTGGGAFLEVLEGKTLPAFDILQKRAAG